MSTVTINDVAYDVPEAVATYVTEKQAAERRAIALGKKAISGHEYGVIIRFCDLSKKQQLAHVLKAIVEHEKGTLALLQLSTEFAAMYKAARDKGEEL